MCDCKNETTVVSRCTCEEKKNCDADIGGGAVGGAVVGAVVGGPVGAVVGYFIGGLAGVLACEGDKRS